MDKPLINRVAESGLININLEHYFPQEEFAFFDIKDYLYMELILKEKDFRAALKAFDWSTIEGKILLVTCSADAIVPTWAYMLIASKAQPFAKEVFEGTQEEYLKLHYKAVLNSLDIAAYEDQRIVIKGCSEKPVPTYAYLLLTALVRPVAKSVMFGEPCSTVPIYKKPRR